MTDHDTQNDDIETGTEAPKSSGGSGGGNVTGIIIGAALAAAGFGSAWYVQDQRLTALKTSVFEQIAQVNDRIDALPVVDLDPVTTALAQTQDTLTVTDGKLGDLADGVTQLTDRVAAAEVMASGGVADAGQAATYVQQVEARLAQLESNATSITKASDELRAEASAAEAAARLAEARASLSQLRSALGNGAPFADALGPLSALVDIPEALQATAADGVPTMELLRSDLPGASRAALAAVRDDSASGEAATGIGGFLQKQFSLRSTTVRQGSSTDAILSRVNAAIQSDDLPAAMTEMSNLSEIARVAMGDWPSLAQTRADAVAAADQVAQTLSEK